VRHPPHGSRRWLLTRSTAFDFQNKRANQFHLHFDVGH
jgi:hypothetical protein